MTRRFDDSTMSGDLAAWHAEDSPDCAAYMLRVGPAGYRCVWCGWLCLDADLERLVDTYGPRPVGPLRRLWRAVRRFLPPAPGRLR